MMARTVSGVGVVPGGDQLGQAVDLAGLDRVEDLPAGSSVNGAHGCAAVGRDQEQSGSQAATCIQVDVVPVAGHSALTENPPALDHTALDHHTAGNTEGLVPVKRTLTWSASVRVSVCSITAASIHS